MKINKSDTSFVEACGCPKKRAELLDSLIIQRRISSITVYVFVLVYFADYFFADSKIFSIDKPFVLVAGILVGMVVSKSDADTKIKILLMQK